MTWATDSVFVAGGDFVTDAWPDFQAQTGVSAVITVSPLAPPAYGEPLPMAALWLPVADEAAYTLEQLALGADFIAAALDARRRVLLHGPHGVHRTRPLVAAHLLRQGKTLARVLREIEDKPWLPPYHGSRELLEALADQWGTGRAAPGRREPAQGARPLPADAAPLERPEP
jgi:hypothetical protein